MIRMQEGRGMGSGPKACRAGRCMMGIGQRIRQARTERQMTQQQLADAVHVTQQSVAQWEKDDSLTDYNKVLDVARVLGVTPRYLISGEEEIWTLHDEIFSEKRMYTRMATIAQTKNLQETARALVYADEKHKGMVRKASPFAQEDVPYITHPLMMACHAFAMGIDKDVVLATILLHDVCEDCGVRPEDLPFSDPVRHAVALLTKPKLPKNATKEERKKRDEKYYAGIWTDSTASIVKAIDRCNNVSMMSLSFTDDKLREYITETETYVLPLLRHIKHDFLEYSNAEFLINYQLRTTMETIKAMLNRNSVI